MQVDRSMYLSILTSSGVASIQQYVTDVQGRIISNINSRFEARQPLSVIVQDETLVRNYKLNGYMDHGAVTSFPWNTKSVRCYQL